MSLLSLPSMANTNLPPQAFTREDLAKAYVWVQSQPDYVKNMATSKDALVALYLQARRNGVASLESIAPVSSRDFKSQLQSLATELNQFEKPKETLTAPQPVKPAQVIPSTPEFAQNFENKAFEFDPPKPMAQPRYDERSIELKVSERRIPEAEGLSLDPKSQQIVDSIKAHLNMESEKDIVRMLISLGYEKLKTILPNR